MITTLRPATLLFYGLALAAAVSIASLAAHARRRDGAVFGHASIALVGCLTTMSFLGGFSIGPALILVTAVFSMALVVLAPRHPTQTALVAALSVTLALGMWTGRFMLASAVIRASLAIAIVVSLAELARRRRSRSDAAFAGWGITLVACLGGLSLILGYPGALGVSLGLAWAGVAAGLALALLTPRFRLALILLAAADLLLALTFLGY